MNDPIGAGLEPRPGVLAVADLPRVAGVPVKALLVAVLVLVATTAAARCVWSTVSYPGGRTLTCSTCCYGGQCFTDCW